MTLRRAAGLVALLYALAVWVLNFNTVNWSVLTVPYAAATLVAPVIVLALERLGREADVRHEAYVQTALGVIFGIWALPATSGLVAILAVVAGVSSIWRSTNRGISAASLIVGVGIGVGLLFASLARP